MDWQPEEGNLFDDNEDNEEESYEFATGKDRAVFLIDAHPAMFQPVNEEEGSESFFSAALRCAVEEMKTRIVSSPNDEVGICFFNTREKKNIYEGNSVYMFQECGVPSAQRIRDAMELAGSFKQRIGSCSTGRASSKEHTNPLYYGLFAAQHQFQGSAKLGSKRVLLFTNNDDPFTDDLDARSARSQTIKKAKDLEDSGILVDLVAMNKPGEEFDVRLFYKDVVRVDDESNFSVLASQKLDDLLNQMKKKTMTKRILRRQLLTVSEGVHIGVKAYALVRQARIASAGWVNAQDNVPIKVETSLVCNDTGALLSGPIKRSIPYGGDLVLLMPEEASEIKKLAPPGLRLLGFKPMACLKDYHNLRSADFLYPDEESVSGSTKAFIALHTAMKNQDSFALASYTPTRSPTRLVAIIVQEEVVTPEGAQSQPPGFEMLYLPYGNDIREAEKYHLSEEGGPAPRASEEEVALASEVTRLLTLADFTVETIHNPALQRHYAILQAVALEEDDLPEVVDDTAPQEKALNRAKATEATEALKAAVYGAGYDEAEEDGSTAKAAKAGAAAQKRKAEADAAKDSASGYDWVKLAKAGKLNTLKNDELKIYLRANGLMLGGSKAALVDRICDHLEKSKLA